MYREKELIKYRAVWLTKEGYDILRKLKKQDKKSMMRVIDDLLKEVK